jgi:hypothetical protein
MTGIHCLGSTGLSQWGTLGGIRHRVIKSRQFKDLRAHVLPERRLSATQQAPPPASNPSPDD